MKNIPLHIKLGLYTGIATIAWMLIEFFVGWHSSNVGAKTVLIGYILFFVGLFFAIKNTAEKHLNNELHLKIGVLIGLQFTLAAALINFVGVFVYYQFINPNFANFWANEGVKILSALGKSKEEITLYKKDLIANYTPIKQATKSLMFFMVTGAFFSFIITIMLRLFAGFGTNKK